MTKAEAINELNYIKESFAKCELSYEALDMAIKTLQEQPKTGEWNMCYDDDAPQDGIWFCSVCGYARFVDDTFPQNFCPNCGCRMKEGE